MKTPSKLVEDVEYSNGIGFRLVWWAKEHVANVTVYRVLSVDGDGEPMFWRLGSPHNGNPTRLHREAEEYLSGFVKWDGCTELNQGRPHWCGPEEYKAHAGLLKHIYHTAHQLMGREPETPWDEEL